MEKLKVSKKIDFSPKFLRPINPERSIRSFHDTRKQRKSTIRLEIAAQDISKTSTRLLKLSRTSRINRPVGKTTQGKEMNYDGTARVGLRVENINYVMVSSTPNTRGLWVQYYTISLGRELRCSYFVLVSNRNKIGKQQRHGYNSYTILYYTVSVSFRFSDLVVGDNCDHYSDDQSDHNAISGRSGAIGFHVLLKRQTSD